jgi:glycosyltransferase involved in cell wall biosynthesis
MTPKILVSVIIPNYNHSLYLKQRIDSVLNQTFQDFELIILDDCSSDSSKEIIEQYRQNPKVSQIIFNQINSGSVFKQWAEGNHLEPCKKWGSSYLQVTKRILDCF